MHALVSSAVHAYHSVSQGTNSLLAAELIQQALSRSTQVAQTDPATLSRSHAFFRWQKVVFIKSSGTVGPSHGCKYTSCVADVQEPVDTLQAVVQVVLAWLLVLPRLPEPGHQGLVGPPVHAQQV